MLEKLIWAAYCGLEEYMLLRKQFFPILDYLADPAARAALQPLAPLQLPVNTPIQTQQQAWQQACVIALQNASAKATEVPFEYIFAVCESSRVASAFLSKGKMTAWMQPSNEIKLNMIEEEKGWIQTLAVNTLSKKTTSRSKKKQNAVPFNTNVS